MSQNGKTKIDVVKKIKIYKNKSGSIIEKKIPIVETHKNSVNYENNANKKPQYKIISSILKNSVIQKMNNSMARENNIHQNFESDINFNIKNNNIYNDFKNMNLHLNELNPPSINLL